MDALSDILRNIHLQGSVYFNSCFCSPWGLDIADTERASFHIIERGQCWLQMESLPEPVPLVGGDILILPHSARHQISDQPDTTCLSGKETVERIVDGHNPFVGDLENFNIVCGYFEFEKDGQKPFIDALPDMIHLNQQHRHQFSWLDTALKLVVSETSMNQPGKGVLTDRITEVLFIQVIRAYMQLNNQSDNFLAALKDKQLSIALTAMHQFPEKNWTLESLALEAGMSRSIFANRFHSLVGMTPMKSLLNCRMQLAKQHIEHSSDSLFNIAEQVGYTSDSAFKKAFKRFFDRTPASFRKS
jgi:AraC-like DNA-binding protein